MCEFIISKAEIFKHILCLFFSAFAVYQDFKEYKIKNKLCMSFLLIGLVLNVILLGKGGLIDSIVGLLIPLILFPLFALRMLGAGDIKAFCAIGAIVGKGNILYVMAYSIISGGVIALIYMLVRKNAKERMYNLYTYLFMGVATKKFSGYSTDKSDGSKFRFSYGIMLGILIMFLGYLFN